MGEPIPQSRLTINVAAAMAAGASGNDAVDRGAPFRPLSAGTKRWAPVSVLNSMVNIHGGYSRRGEAARSIEYAIGGTTHTFVALDKNAPWFLRGVGGPSIKKGDLKAVHALTMLRHAVNRHLGLEDNSTAVADTAAVAEPQCDSQPPDDDVDPMDTLDDVLEPIAKTPRASKKLTPRTLDRAAIVDLEVPTRPACAGPTHDGTTVVCIYKPPSTDKRSNGMLFLRVDSVDWLLAYAADELFFQSVMRLPPAPSEAATGNCAAVAGLRLEWNFHDKAWTASFVDGPFAGTRRDMGVKDLTQSTWTHLKDMGLSDGYFTRATPVQKKNAVKELMILWGESVARDNVAEFNAILTSPELRTPPRRAKRQPADDTVVKEDACAAVADS